MAIATSPLFMAAICPEPPSAAPLHDEIYPNEKLCTIVREGLTRKHKQLPPYLFYDEVGSELFDRITQLPEYYLTRMERALFHAHASEMIAAASEGRHLQLIELGAGSADKTRTLLAATLEQQHSVRYLPVDVSPSALDIACGRIQAELPGVITDAVVADYTVEWNLPANNQNEDAPERQLLLWIGSSIGNFEPDAAEALLKRINATMRTGDSLLLGVDLAPCPGGKCVGELLAAYDDEAGVTAQFNLNLLARLNRELGANFDLDNFAHWAEWNSHASRMEMHIESLCDQHVRIPALNLTVPFAAGEHMHTENSYKYTREHISELMQRAGFPVCESWTDEGEWFAVLLGRKA
jgi:L-histidine N-alpha-methyltransferase